MRNRRKTYTDDVMQNNPYLIKETAKITLESYPIHLEIGTGKGGFIVGMSQMHPHIQFIGLEKEREIIVMAARLLEQRGVNNTKLIHGNADELLQYFELGQINRIYLNFSDPWPKSGHAKRRLTYRRFLEHYKQLLTEGGQLHFKTDNQGFFDFSLREFSEMGWQQTYCTRNLHQEAFHLSGENVMTEYEKRFSDLGQPIYRACFEVKQ